jgi:hypothetical protein
MKLTLTTIASLIVVRELSTTTTIRLSTHTTTTPGALERTMEQCIILTIKPEEIALTINTMVL